MTLERPREGVAKPKAEGLCKGRRPKSRARDDTRDDSGRALAAEGKTVTEIAKALEIAGRASIGHYADSVFVAKAVLAYANLLPSWMWTCG